MNPSIEQICPAVAAPLLNKSDWSPHNTFHRPFVFFVAMPACRKTGREFPSKCIILDPSVSASKTSICLQFHNALVPETYHGFIIYSNPAHLLSVHNQSCHRNGDLLLYISLTSGTRTRAKDI